MFSFAWFCKAGCCWLSIEIIWLEEGQRVLLPNNSHSYCMRLVSSESSISEFKLWIHCIISFKPSWPRLGDRWTENTGDKLGGIKGKQYWVDIWKTEAKKIITSRIPCVGLILLIRVRRDSTISASSILCSPRPLRTAISLANSAVKEARSLAYSQLECQMSLLPVLLQHDWAKALLVNHILEKYSFRWGLFGSGAQH